MGNAKGKGFRTGKYIHLGRNARPINSASIFVRTGATSAIIGQTAEQIYWTLTIHAIQVLATTCARVPVAMGAIVVVVSNNARPINSTSTFVMTGATSAIFGRIVEQIIRLRKEQVRKTWNMVLLLTSIPITRALATDVTDARHKIMSNNLRTQRY